MKEVSHIRRRPTVIVKAASAMTPAEQARFVAAVHGLLAEIVRHVEEENGHSPKEGGKDGDR